MNKIPLLTLCHSSHDFLFDEFFEPSVEAHLKDSFRIVRMNGYQSEQVIFDTQSFRNLMKIKIQSIYDFMIESSDDFFVYSDSDVIFFNDIKEQITEALKDKDMAFQLNGNLSLSAGFFASRINNKVKYFFKSMLDSYDTNICDERTLNMSIDSSGIEYSFLGAEFFTFGTINGPRYGDKDVIFVDPETPIFPISMFHANYIIGIEKKTELLNHYKKWNNKGTHDYYNGNLFLLGLLPYPYISLNEELLKYGYKDLYNSHNPLKDATVNRYLSGETIVFNLVNIAKKYSDAKYLVLKLNKDDWVEYMSENVTNQNSLIRKILNREMYGKINPSREDFSQHFDLWDKVISDVIADYDLDYISVIESNIDSTEIHNFLRYNDE